MDSGDKMIFVAIVIVLFVFLFAIFYCKDFSENYANPGMIKPVWTYNASLEKEYRPNDFLNVIAAEQDLVATRAPLSDMDPNAGIQLREGMPYKADKSGFRKSYKDQLNTLMTEEDQIYYLGRGLSPLYNKDSPYYPPVNPAQPMMPVSMTSSRKLLAEKEK